MSTPGDDEAIREAVRAALRELMPEALQQGASHAHNGHAHNGDAHNGHAHNGHSGNGTSGNGHASPDVVPLVPAPPIAAVMRPSTWRGPAVPGEIVGSGAASPAAEPAATMQVQPQATGVPPQPRREPDQSAIRVPAPPLQERSSRPAPLGGTVETVRIDGDEDLQAFVHSMVARLESPRDRLAIKAGQLRFQLQRSAAPVGPTVSDARPAVRVTKGAVTERHVREAHANGARLLLSRAAVLTPLARDTARALDVQIEREAQC
jgi:hypothetical protein